ncbi:hypothetical protein [Streptomyces sp. PA5.6]|uniref:hypothetical protein n=1 Tax=Streptomyces sp. PA5.6 TaxID=3035651 RepID=UPI003904D532
MHDPELLHLLASTDPTPDQLRRIAELTDLHFDFETAKVWYQKAAQAGDQDAADYLEADDDQPTPDIAELRELLIQLALRKIAASEQGGDDPHHDGR